MNHRGLITWIRIALLCIAAGIAAGANAADSYAVQSNRIVSDRAAANAKFADQERDCKARFVVTSCMDAALKEQRATLNRLHQEQLQLDEQKRHDAAAARREEIRAKADAQDARASDAVPAPPRERTRSPPQPRSTAPFKMSSPKRPNAPWLGTAGADTAASSPDQRAIEKRNEERYEAAERAAKVHREEVEKRNAERAAKGKIAAPLPVPSAASAASAP
jgi:colicin import membrane protein